MQSFGIQTTWVEMCRFWVKSLPTNFKEKPRGYFFGYHRISSVFIHKNMQIYRQRELIIITYPGALLEEL